MGKLPFFRQDGEPTSVYSAPRLLVAVNTELERSGDGPISMEVSDGFVYIDPVWYRVPEKLIVHVMGKFSYIRKDDTPTPSESPNRQ